LTGVFGPPTQHQKGSVRAKRKATKRRLNRREKEENFAACRVDLKVSPVRKTKARGKEIAKTHHQKKKEGGKKEIAARDGNCGIRKLERTTQRKKGVRRRARTPYEGGASKPTRRKKPKRENKHRC